jgi:hypothetical protein
VLGSGIVPIILVRGNNACDQQGEYDGKRQSKRNLLHLPSKKPETYFILSQGAIQSPELQQFFIVAIFFETWGYGSRKCPAGS